MPFGVGVFVPPKALVTIFGVVVGAVALISLLAAPSFLSSGDPGAITYGVFGLAVWSALVALVVRRRNRERERERLVLEARAHAAARRFARRAMTGVEKLEVAEHASAKAVGAIGHGSVVVARRA